MMSFFRHFPSVVPVPAPHSCFRSRFPRILLTPKTPPACYLAKLFWPCGQLPNSFIAEIVYSHNTPTEIYKVIALFRYMFYIPSLHR